jgi:hypothetical protein
MPMKKLVLVVILSVAIAAPANALTAQQQRMKDCNSQASGMKGDARKQFMSTCLSGGSAQTKAPKCTNGKPCGNTCIAANEVCRQP